MGQDVGRNDLTATQRAEDLDDEQPKRSTAIHTGAHPGLRATKIHCVEGDPERFEQRTLDVGHPLRKGHQQVLRPSNQRPQAPVSPAMAHETQLEAEVAKTSQAQVTTATWIGRVKHDTHSAAWAVLDDACDFVAKDERAAQDSITDRTFDEPMAIGAAQPDSGYAHQLLAIIGDRIWLVV
jgi:hypothetical protein